MNAESSKIDFRFELNYTIRQWDPHHDIKRDVFVLVYFQPCSLTEKKKSRAGSVVMPYIMSSTLRRMSTISNASSGHSSGSGSSDGNSSRPASQESVFTASCFLISRNKLPRFQHAVRANLLQYRVPVVMERSRNDSVSHVITFSASGQTWH